MSRVVTVTRTYLELTDRALFRPATIDDDPSLRLARVPVMSVPLAQRLYREVGAAYHWVDRWAWTTAQWQEWVTAVGAGTWILTVDGDLAGFVELRAEEDDVEIALMGLVQRFHGRGLGKHLLSKAVELAWAIGGRRVWLHTCTLDGPTALPNYLARGFTPYRTETYEATLDDA